MRALGAMMALTMGAPAANILRLSSLHPLPSGANWATSAETGTDPMCTFITLIAATDDLERVNAILATLDRRGHARRAERVDTPGLRRLLAAHEREYVISRAPCDCGTLLGSALRHESDPDAARTADIARYRRKGWSESRIARAMSDKDRAPTRSQRSEDAAYWIDLMTALAEGLGLKRLGLMHHFYEKSPGHEPATATRREAGTVRGAAEALALMADAVIHDFETGLRGR